MRVTFHHRGRQTTVRVNSLRSPAYLPLWELFLTSDVVPAAACARARAVGYVNAPFALYVHGRPVPFSKKMSGAVPFSWVLRALPGGAPLDTSSSSSRKL